MNSPDPDLIVALAQELKEAKTRAAALQAKWDRYFSLPDSGGNVNIPFPRKGGRKAMPDSVTGRVMSLLSSDPSKNFDKDEMGIELGIDHKQAERTLLKLFSIGKISRPSRGHYSAKRMEIVA